MANPEKSAIEFVTVQTCAECKRVHELQLEAAFKSAVENTKALKRELRIVVGVSTVWLTVFVAILQLWGVIK
jgi:hypothetical protein